jgi:hypothetical protein
VSETFDIVMNDAGVSSSLRHGDQSSNRDAILYVPLRRDDMLTTTNDQWQN